MSEKIFYQYILMRRDLISKLNWPLGAVAVQACHACIAALWNKKDSEEVLEYTKNLDDMHKIMLEVSSEEELLKYSQKLTENEISYKLWIEQPENIPTCLATAPYTKEKFKKLFKGLKMFN